MSKTLNDLIDEATRHLKLHSDNEEARRAAEHFIDEALIGAGITGMYAKVKGDPGELEVIFVIGERPRTGYGYRKTH